MSRRLYAAPALFAALFFAHASSAWACDEVCMRQRNDFEQEMNRQGYLRQQQAQAQAQAEAEAEAQFEGPVPAWRDSIATVALHPEASDGWIATSFRSLRAAQTAALAACEKAMGPGCVLGAATRNGAIAIARDQDGGLWTATASNERGAERAVIATCAHAGAACVPFNTHQAMRQLDMSKYDTGIVLEPMNGYRMHYAAAAWVEGDSAAWGRKVWISGDHATRAEAERSAIDACHRDSGLVCTLAHSVPETFITVSVQSDRAIRVGTSSSEQTASREVVARCRAAKVSCTLTGVFPATQGGIVVHDVDRDAIPARR